MRADQRPSYEVFGQTSAMSSSLYAQNKLKVTGNRGVVRKSRTLPRIRKGFKPVENLSIDACNLRPQSTQGSSLSATMEVEQTSQVPLITSASHNAQSEPNLREKAFGTSFYPFK